MGIYTLKVLFERTVRVDTKVERVDKAELLSLSNVHLEFAGQKMRWGNGVLSGYKWMALVDSILNAAVTRHVMDKLGREKRRPKHDRI